MDKIEVTQADRTLYHQLLSLGSVNLNRRRMGLPIVDGFELIAAHRLATRTDATPVADSDETFLTAYVSANTNIIGIDHPTEAPWQQVYDAHLALRDRLNERLEQEDLCPYKPEAGTNTHPPATDVAALVENGCEMPEVAAMRYIEELRGDLAASVTILCDNEEAWTKDEQMAVEVIAEWTDWLAKRFMGESVIQCLARAIGARRTTLAALKDRTHG